MINFIRLYLLTGAMIGIIDIIYRQIFGWYCAEDNIMKVFIYDVIFWPITIIMEMFDE